MTEPAETAPRVLDVAGVARRYGERWALRDVSLAIRAGEVCCLLGPNGAGKTTLVSIIAGLRSADAGTVTVDGLDVSSGGRDVRTRIGLAGQETGVYPTVTVRQNLDFWCRVAGMTGGDRRRRIDEVAETLELTDLLDRKARFLSGGQRRRLHAAVALVHRPRLLMLDEPTTGVDISTRSRLLAAVSRLAEVDGCAVLYTTHYLPEVEELRATVVILDRGRILARGTLDELIARHGAGMVELTFDGPPPPIPDVPDRAGIDADTEVGIEVDGPTARIPTDRPAATAASLLGRLSPADAERLESVELSRPSLDSVFLAITGRAYPEDEAAASAPADAARPGQGADHVGAASDASPPGGSASA